jgi:NTE family protein
MTHPLRHLTLLIAMLALLAGCGYPVRNQIATQTSKDAPYSWATLPADPDEGTLVVVTASGGGTRAAALVAAVLQTMHHVRLPDGNSLADEIDIISSVSGGSVTAGYFALHGTAGLDRLTSDFIRRDGMTTLAWRGLNPVGLARLSTPAEERIDLLIDYLDEQLFHQATFADLAAKKRRPYLILNAGDMVEGTPFPFTQYTMDLLCSDLGSVKLSTAVAASAAFPVALSPVTLTNYAPCPGLVSRPVWINQALATSWHTDPARHTAGRVADAYATGRKRYIHLLDGGIADNLGVAEPYRLLSNEDVSPLLRNQIRAGQIGRIVFVMINARSFSPSELDSDPATPGMIDMLLASINSSIDRATFSTGERLRQLLTQFFANEARAAESRKQPEIAENFRRVAKNTHYIAIDFDAIRDAGCRQSFHSIPTTWALPDAQIDGLMAMGEALFAEHPSYREMLSAMGARPDQAFRSIQEACNTLLPPQK